MISFFDVHDKYEIPSLILANPNQTQLFSMGVAYDRQLKLRYNALSELSFVVPAYLDNINNPVEYYDSLVSRRLVYVENIGYFVITGVDETGDGVRKEKQITAMSYDYDFVVKKLSVFKGTYEFYDPISPSGTLIYELLSRVPNWTVGTIDADLWTLYRTFDVTDSTIYNFLMEEVEKAYNCVFVFDYINRTISAYSVANATTNTDIYLSYDNLIKSIKINELTDELVTALSVYGSDPLSINQVNPLGTDTIYNFTYFKNLDWMSGSAMVQAVTDWENKVALNQPTYANLLTSLMTQNGILLAKQSELAELKSQLAALEGVRNARIQQRLDISAITGQVNAKQAEVTAKEAEITAQNVVIAGITAQLTAINTDLSFETNFTLAQQNELSNFIFGSTYTNSNFVQTDTMDLVDIQSQAQQLYDQAQTVLTRVSQPRWSFDVDSANFVFLKEFQTFINQLALGCIVSVEKEDGVVALPVLLEIDLNYDSPEDFKLVFGNRLRLDSAAFVLSDLLGQSVQTGIDANFQSEQWNNFSDNYQDDVSTFMSSALNAALNNVISSTNQEIVIDQNGLTGKQMLSAGVYDPRQVKLVNNMLAFTKDNWQTASLALGEIITSSGSAYGLVADVIVGNLIAGNELRISNDANTFTLDGGGATLTNAIFKLTTTNGNSQILLDPQDGIRIRGLDATSGSLINKLWMDADGNLNIVGTANIEGSIIANLGYIGGWRIANDGLYDSHGNYILSTGAVRLGALSINGNTGYFTGNFWADNLLGLLQEHQIGSVNANVITSGTMLADRIFGGTIRWGGTYNNPECEMGTTGTGVTQINARNSAFDILLNGGTDGIIGMRPSEMTILHNNDLTLQSGWDQNGNIHINCANLISNGAVGQTQEVYPNFSKLRFVNGLFVEQQDGGSGGNPGAGISCGVSFTMAGDYGIAAYAEAPFDFMLTNVSLVADVASYLRLQIWNYGYDAHPGTLADSIAECLLFYTTKNYYSGWATPISKGSILAINVTGSNYAMTTASLTLSGWRI